MIKILLTMILILLPSLLRSQSVSGIRHEPDNDQIIIFYDLASDWPASIAVHLSTDGGRSFGFHPLKTVSGDVGENILPGRNKKMIWRTNRETVKNGADLAFWIKAGSRFGIFIDERDGKKYKTVRIGNQVWMAENLNYDAGCKTLCYDNHSGNCSRYGRLYTWEEAKKALPQGWRLPAKED